MRPFVIELPSEWQGIISALLQPPADLVVVHAAGSTPSGQVLEQLLYAARHSTLVATVSPIPLAVGDGAPTLHAQLDLPPPTLAGPEPRLVLLTKDALESVLPMIDGSLDWPTALAVWSAHALRMGWRHVAAPGLSLRQGPDVPGMAVQPDPRIPGWFSDYRDGSIGPANEFLDAHRLHCELDLRALRLAVDGSCLLGEPTTGTHHVVLQSMRELARTRPEAEVTLVAPTGAHNFAKRFLAGIPNAAILTKSEVEERFDVVYRPYQIYSPGELEWCRNAGNRLVLSQLDVIAFSNPWYYPRLDVFYSIRNLIRTSLRMADGVTFISEFGRRSVEEQVAGLDDRRTSVVHCGTDHVHPETPERPAELPPDLDRFLFCLSATFWHKNRPLVYQTFRKLRELGYTGCLVVAGPEPFYGRSADADGDEIHQMPADVQADIIHLANVSERQKWWLLTRAEFVLYPSIVEGFGLVPFEAMTAGTPALFRSGTALAEIMGDEVVMAASWRAEEWAGILMQWAADPAAAERQVAAIREVGSKLTWSRSAESLWAHVDAVLRLPRRDAMPGGAEGGALSVFPRLHLQQSTVQRSTRFARRVVSYAKRRLRTPA